MRISKPFRAQSHPSPFWEWSLFSDSMCLLWCDRNPLDRSPGYTINRVSLTPFEIQMFERVLNDKLGDLLWPIEVSEPTVHG